MKLIGPVIEYQRNDGTVIKGLVNAYDQCVSLRKKSKVVVTILEDDFTVKLDSEQKPMKVITSAPNAKTIAFLD